MLVAADDPLDTYLVHHPEAMFGQPVEATVMDPDNPHVLAPHLAAAAAELPLGEADLPMFGPDAAAAARRPGAARHPAAPALGWFWARTDRATDHVSLRGAGEVVAVVERAPAGCWARSTRRRRTRRCTPGAVHVHQGETYVVTELDLEAEHGARRCGATRGGRTHAQSVSAFDIVGAERTARWGPVEVSLRHGAGAPPRSRRFLRRLPSGEVLGTHPLDLPRRPLRPRRSGGPCPTTCWPRAGVEPTVDARGRCTPPSTPPSGCCRSSPPPTAGTSAGSRRPCTPTPALPTIMVFDGYPGGAGFAERGFDAVRGLGAATRDAVLGAACASGCPACVQSPKCGNGNEPLDKAGAVTVLCWPWRRPHPDLTPFRHHVSPWKGARRSRG